MDETEKTVVAGGLPTMPPTPESEPFYKVWIKALTKPNEQTYAEIASAPNAKAMTAYLWIFAAYLVNAFLSSLVQTATVRPLLEQLGVDPDLVANRGIGSILISAICGAPVAAVIGTILFALGVFIIQWIAKLFGGTGTPEKLAYAFGAILAPYLLVGSVLSLLTAIPYVGLCFGLITFLFLLYALVLQIMAVKGINNISWGAAIGSVLIPLFVFIFVCGCLVGLATVVVGAALRDTINSIY